MDLRNNDITIGEILSDPKAEKILRKEFPELMNPTILRMARSMTLNKVLRFAGRSVPQNKINRVIEELKKI